jgi:hypothetical protein
MVSPIETSWQPTSTSRRVTSTTFAGSTRPSYGQPKQVDT